jgi:pimeloyl-ACP methyl ester carboxylesterase
MKRCTHFPIFLRNSPSKSRSVGHSDGASIALIYAGAHDRVRGLVLLAPHGFVEDRSVESIARVKKRF